MRVLQAVMCVGLLAGCSAQWPMTDDPASPQPMRLAGVPFYPQEGFRCGPAAMSMVLDWTGLNVKPTAIEAQFSGAKDPRKRLVETANRFGRLAYPISGTGALMTELAAGHPVVVVQNLGVDSQPLWNCLVAVGFDRGRNEVVVHAGDQAGKRMSLRLFERLWSDSEQWGLVVLRPGEMPAAARQADYVKAAYALERAGRYWEAVLAYDAALASWPNDGDTLMGLGSSLYLLGDVRGAADAYRAAAAVSSDPTLARAALSQIVSELPHGEAMPIAEKTPAAPLPRPTKASRAITEASN